MKKSKNFRCLLILFELQLKESNKYRLVEISRTDLETYTADLFVVKDEIFNEVEGILLIHVKAKDKVIMFLHNIKSKKIEESITVFENEPRLDDDGGSTKIFFVNHIDFEGGIIVAVSHVVKQMKVFSRCGKIGYRLLLSESLDINDVRHSHAYGAYCVSNRNNQILFLLFRTVVLLFMTYLTSLRKHRLLLDICKLMAYQICSLMNLEKNFT